MTVTAKLLTVENVAALMSVSPRHVWRLISTKQLSAVRIGERCTRVSMQELDRFLSQLPAVS